MHLVVGLLICRRSYSWLFFICWILFLFLWMQHFPKVSSRILESFIMLCFIFKFSSFIRIISVSSMVSFSICLLMLSWSWYGLCLTALPNPWDEFVCVNLEVERAQKLCVYRWIWLTDRPHLQVSEDPLPTPRNMPQEEDPTLGQKHPRWRLECPRELSSSFLRENTPRFYTGVNTWFCCLVGGKVHIKTFSESFLRFISLILLLSVSESGASREPCLLLWASWYPLQWFLSHCFLLTLHSQPFPICLLSSRNLGKAVFHQWFLSSSVHCGGAVPLLLCLSALSPLEQFLSEQTWSYVCYCYSSAQILTQRS